jgi:hypothetical protein
MERTPDGRILINCPNQVNVLHVIQHPDLKGVACDLRQHDLILAGNIFWSMPHYPNYRLGALGEESCDSTTLVSEISSANELYLFPNPAGNFINVNWTSDSDLLTGQIYNVLGQPVKGVTLRNGEATLDISNLHNGTYYLIVNDPETRISGSSRFIVSRN